jgi:two-component system, NarL family, response regulator LiaR
MGKKPDIRVQIAAPHLIFSRGLRTVLEAEGGFKVVGEAKNGKEAIDLAKLAQPDALLLDVSVPGLMGLEVLQELPKTAPDLRTVLLTEAMNKSEIIEGLLLGARGIVSKESSSLVLFKSIRAVMAGEIWVARGVLSVALEMLRHNASS